MKTKVKVLAVRILSVAPLVWLTFSATAQSGNSVSVLHEGYVSPIEGKTFVPGQSDDGARRVASTISLVRGGETVLVADPGMVGDFPKVLARLKAEGVAPADVTHVFISHHHPDHTIYVGLFPNAELVDFWGVYKGDHWRDHPDPYELAPGIRVVRTPGHTKEDASLVVETGEGVYVLTHLWWMPGLAPEVDPLAWSQAELEKHRKAMLKIADWIVPGHGKMFKNPAKNP